MSFLYASYRCFFSFVPNPSKNIHSRLLEREDIDVWSERLSISTLGFPKSNYSLGAV